MHNVKVKKGRLLYDGKEFVMTIDELIVELTKLSNAGHGKDYVVTSKDAEGNGFNAVHKCCVTTGRFDPNEDAWASDEDIQENGNDEEYSYLYEDMKIKAICIG